MAKSKYVQNDGINISNQIFKELGIEKAFLYSLLLLKALECGSTDLIFSVNDMRDKTGMSDFIQRRCLKELQQLGYVRVFCKGDEYVEGSPDYRASRRHIEVLKRI
jgi:hypothetical protein